MGKTRILDRTAVEKTKYNGSPEERPIGMLPRSSDIGSKEKIIIFKIGFIRFPKWRRADSNRWPPACKAGALPIELRPHKKMGLSGIEPLTSRLSGERSNRLSYRPIMFVNIQGANKMSRGKHPSRSKDGKKISEKRNRSELWNLVLIIITYPQNFLC